LRQSQGQRAYKSRVVQNEKSGPCARFSILGLTVSAEMLPANKKAGREARFQVI